LLYCRLIKTMAAYY